MLHLLQKDVFGEHHYAKLVDALERLSLSFLPIFIKPGTRELLGEDGEPVKVDTDNVFCWGSVRLAHIAGDYGWSPGSFFNDAHDYRVYAERYGREMLNADSRIIRFSESFEPPSPIFFARPCGDTKAFTGQCFMKSSWDEFVKFHLENGKRPTLNEDTAVQVAPRRDIHREFRTWVVKGKVVTASQYKRGTAVVHEHCSEPEVLEYAQRMADVYCPAEAFVLDVCMTEDGMRIVEVNCINCAGFYCADLQKLLAAVEGAFGQSLSL